MTRPDSICFGLLTGGKSSRMGSDKAALIWQGQPLWQHQLRLAAEIGASEILVSGNPNGPYRNAARVVPDEISNRGPLAGIAALLGSMQSDWLVVVAVDMPLLDGKTLNELISARRGQIGVVPRVNNHAEPLAAVYPRAVLPLAQRQLKTADLSLQTFVREAAAAKLVQLHQWPIERTICFRSVNTPDELAALESVRSRLHLPVAQ